MRDKLKMDAPQESILKKYGLSASSRIGSGMEAEVYVYDADTVVKLYKGTTALRELTILQEFYRTLDRAAIPYDLPCIRSIEDDGQFIVTVENRLSGTPMSSVLPALKAHQLDTIMERYLAAALALSAIQMPENCQRYKLFDATGISQQSHGDWHQFLIRYLEYKYRQLKDYLARDVTNIESKLQLLQEILRQPYRGAYQLIHGDYFPGNLLIDNDYYVTALLDFGLLTLYGDALFDLATGWVLFDMYDELKANVRSRYLDVLLGALGADSRGKLFRYVLLYSIFTANTYSPNCTDGHYEWCVDNLNNQHYWAHAA